MANLTSFGGTGIFGQPQQYNYRPPSASGPLYVGNPFQGGSTQSLFGHGAQLSEEQRKMYEELQKKENERNLFLRRIEMYKQLKELLDLRKEIEEESLLESVNNDIGILIDRILETQPPKEPSQKSANKTEKWPGSYPIIAGEKKWVADEPLDDKLNTLSIF